MRNLIDFDHLTPDDIHTILDDAAQLKANRFPRNDLHGKTLITVFEKPSTRTRVSFDVAMTELGGYVINIDAATSQLGRGETIADTSRVLSRYGHILVLRTDNHMKLLEFVEHSAVPVINGLTDTSHPCQIFADLLTIQEHLGTVEGKTIAWIGDGNNVAMTFIQAAKHLPFTLRLACPRNYGPPADVIIAAKDAGADIMVTTAPQDAVKDADVVVTDTWISMNHEDAPQRRAAFAAFQVTAEMMRGAKPEAIFLHCLPAHRGEEVAAEVIDSKQSVVWDEAENRLHVQKAIIRWCFGG